ncbi:chromosome segregation SMC family protein [Deinococcus soli (ex Cha et al. 2016)]|uniref:Chromosome segregation protein n=2 Tax=Deinococcus soli (ex Cha et al. 2016) TaxID=1309411 RepID=A0ACC6KLZ2_9DEIO|nr:chromosome segregation SMC family protein [Deinococcus soli (ex Cha et al. 2016)]MDR6220457.1 chromosome segregation protein [Deinococcus soli (ex Cha et al. 2016)]MDR6330212.1 chromosome segregation protein [Deinococcus soli (ex Cha et al. 2016)]MDR6753538.1 chromosome segregation protein [Deinococcus soli (ex Cha et al. 2016)]
MLQSVTLQGFKSFADRTRLEFGPGVSAVIGPNGSGKSNVVEAIRWATHQARARDLRAGRGTELIFHGSGGKAPLGLAEVQLELVTPAGDRVNLARRVYRDGTGEQDLNGRGVRVRDVQGALRGTGLGPGGLAVIGQGEVSGVVQAEGRTLLGYVQEAAGLSRAVTARQETEARLREADTHLDSLRLVLNEREAALERLSRAAQDARTHRDLSGRVLTLEDALKRDRQLTLAREVFAARTEAAGLEARSAALAAEVQAAATAVDAARDAAQEARARRDAYAGALDTLRAARDAAAQAQRYRAHLDAERQTLTAELDALPRTPPEQPAPDLTALDAALTQARAQADAAERRARTLDADLTRARTLAARAAEAAARQDASRETIRAEFERAQGNLTQAREALEAAQERLAHARTAREEAERAYLGVRDEREAAAQHERHLRGELARVNASAQPLRRERDRLEQTLNSYARYGEGARNALRLDHPGIVGSVADLLTVPAEYETALGAALGRRLEQVVVNRADDAREIIDELRRVGGRATFLPLDLIRARSRRDGALLREDGVIGNLADLCPSDPPLVAESILADTLVVRDLRAANRIARAHASRPRLVTLDGELVEPGGAITGGRARDTGSGVLGDQRRFQELDAELEDADRQSTRLSAELKKVEATLAGSAERHNTLLAARERSAQEEASAERRVTELGAQTRSLQANHDRLAARLGPDEPEPFAPGETLPDVDALTESLQAARQAAEMHRAQERQAAETLALAREADAAWRAYRTGRARAGDLRARLDTNATSLTAQDAVLDAARAEVTRREAALGTLDENECARAEYAREKASQDYANLIGTQNKARARLDDLRLLIARREGSLEPIPDGCLPPGTPREWTAELTRTRAALDVLGPVNARAEADHAAETELLDAQRAELHDADAAAQELRAHLQELQTAEEHATRAAFDRVNTAFREYSTELLGGQGDLEPETDDAGILRGLRLAVQPRGKRTRSMTLLSAGERTMAGLGFLFALNHAGGEGSAGGLPLAVLDEVDAPLDEANIRRFTAFLGRFSERGAQFLLVTHQKATMEVAHALWGVTTDQTGASRVLSIRQHDDARAG